MNYFEHHIGDYDADTAHLTWVEDMAYTRLLRLYYRREKPIPADLNESCRLVRALTKEQRKAVADVLKEFFVLADDGWHQGRCDAELARYLKKVEHNRSVGKLGGRPRKSTTHEKPAGLSLGSETKPEQNPPQSPVPIPSSSEAIASGGKPPKMTPEEIIFGYGVPLLVSAGSTDKAARSFLGGLRKSAGDDGTVVNALRDCIRAKPLQPLEWLAKALPPDGVGGKQTALERRNAAVVAQLVAQHGVTEDA